MFDRLRKLINDAIKTRKKAKKRVKTLKNLQELIDTLKKQTIILVNTVKDLKLTKDKIKESLEKAKDELRREAKKFKDQGKELNKKSLSPQAWQSLSKKISKVRDNKKLLATVEKFEKAFLTQAVKNRDTGKILEKKISVLKAPDAAKNLKKQRVQLNATYKKLSTKYGSKNFKDFKDKLTKEEKKKLQSSLIAIKKDKATLQEAAKDQQTFKLENAAYKRQKLVKELKKKYQISDDPNVKLNPKLLDAQEKKELINATKEILQHKKADLKIEITSKGPLTPSNTPNNNNKGGQKRSI